MLYRAGASGTRGRDAANSRSGTRPADRLYCTRVPVWPRMLFDNLDFPTVCGWMACSRNAQRCVTWPSRRDQKTAPLPKTCKNRKLLTNWRRIEAPARATQHPATSKTIAAELSAVHPYRTTCAHFVVPAPHAAGRFRGLCGDFRHDPHAACLTPQFCVAQSPAVTRLPFWGLLDCWGRA